MNFLVFLGFYLMSKLIYDVITISLVYGYRYYQKRRLEQAIKDGKIKMVSMTDIINELNNVKKDDTTWN